MFCITIPHKSSCDTLVCPLPSKAIMPTCRSVDVYPHAQNEFHS